MDMSVRFEYSKVSPYFLLRPQAFHGIHQRRFQRLKTNGNDGDTDGSGGRPDENPYPQVDAVVVAVQPMPQKVKRLTNVKLIHYIYFC